jgi:prolyl-tRNA synthetase
MIGGIIMTHGDEKGLRLPPRLAPIQVVIVPISRNDDERTVVMENVTRLQRELVAADIRVHVDTRDFQPGFKFNDWEMRGVPVRLEMGPRDVQAGTVVAARRDIPGKEGKRPLQQEGIASSVTALLDEIQAHMLQQATDFRESNTHDVKSVEELRSVIEQGGFARGWWAGATEDELQLKADTGATHRCYPLEQPGGSGTCFLTGKPAERVAIFGKAY